MPSDVWHMPKPGPDVSTSLGSISQGITDVNFANRCERGGRPEIAEFRSIEGDSEAEHALSYTRTCERQRGNSSALTRSHIKVNCRMWNDQATADMCNVKARLLNGRAPFLTATLWNIRVNFSTPLYSRTFFFPILQISIPAPICRQLSFLSTANRTTSEPETPTTEVCWRRMDRWWSSQSTTDSAF